MDTNKFDVDRLDAERYRYLRVNFASVGMHGFELNWDQSDPGDALDSMLDAYINKTPLREKPEGYDD